MLQFVPNFSRNESPASAVALQYTIGETELVFAFINYIIRDMHIFLLLLICLSSTDL